MGDERRHPAILGRDVDLLVDHDRFFSREECSCGKIARKADRGKARAIAICGREA
jgi:hypothetical protein